MSEISLEEMIECVNREISFRARVYPRWVRDGKMRPEKAELEMKRMSAVAELLAGLDKGTK